MYRDRRVEPIGNRYYAGQAVESEVNLDRGDEFIITKALIRFK